MSASTKTNIELLPLSEVETLLEQNGKPLSRKEDSGYVIILYLLDGKYIESYYDMHSHEIARVEIINKESVNIRYQNFFG